MRCMRDFLAKISQFLDSLYLKHVVNILLVIIVIKSSYKKVAIKKCS